MQRLVVLFDALAGLALALLLAVTAAGILTRVLFDLTAGRVDLLLSDAVEMATYALLITVFAAMPVTVEVFSRTWPVWLTAALDRFWSLTFGTLAALLAWRYAEESLAVLARGDTTQDMQLPLWIFYAFAVPAFAAAGFVALRLGLFGAARERR